MNFFTIQIYLQKIKFSQTFLKKERQKIEVYEKKYIIAYNSYTSNDLYFYIV